MNIEDESISKIDQLLRDLAEAMGTTVEYVFPKLVQLTFVDTLIRLLAFLTLAIIGIIIALYSRRKYMAIEGHGLSIFEEDTGAGYGWCFIAFSMFAVFMFIGVVCNITGVVVPEAVTIQKIIHMIK